MNNANGRKYNLSDEVLDSLYSVYPFNKFEYIISHLIGTDTITLQQYLDIRNRYLERNKYLYVFEITAPRTFGETWAQRHLNEVVPELQRPSMAYDPDYSGQYDFWYNGIRIEVKASRAVRRKSGDSLIIKALSSDSNYGFDMNFQQLKPACCDVFVWIAVWRDVIRYWVLSSDEVKNNRYYSSRQHRGNVGEGQLWLKDTNIDDFDQYEVGVRDILFKIIEKAGR
jgi:type I restriction/modification enzyme